MELHNYNFGKLLCVDNKSTLGIDDIKRLTGSSVATALRSNKNKKENPVNTLHWYLSLAFQWSRNGIPTDAKVMDKTGSVPPFKIYKLDEKAVSVRYAKARHGAFMAALQFDDGTFRKFYQTMGIIDSIKMVKLFGCPGYPRCQRSIVRNVARLGLKQKNLSLYNGQLHALTYGYAQETLEDALLRIKGYMADKW